MRKNLLPGINLDITEEALIIQSGEPLLCLSSAVVGGGFQETKTIINMHVDKYYSNPNPTGDLDLFARRNGISDPFIGLMTAVYTNDVQLVNLIDDQLQISAVITAGLGNAVAVGLDEPYRTQLSPGTINIILIFNSMLSKSAMVNAVISATEAKTALLQQMGIKTPGGHQPTGTSTDSVVIACQPSEIEYHYAGPLTTPGWMIGKAVRQAFNAQFSLS